MDHTSNHNRFIEHSIKDSVLTPEQFTQGGNSKLGDHTAAERKLRCLFCTIQDSGNGQRSSGFRIPRNEIEYGL